MSNLANLLVFLENRVNPNLDPPALLLKPEEAARYLAIGRTQLFALLADGSLESVQIGRLRRIPFAACARYVEGLRTEAAARPKAI